MKEIIEELLLGTGREGVNELIPALEEIGFFAAPCSTQYHLAKEGGLAEHSLNVCRLALDLMNALCPELPEETVIITSLLHDVGKSGQYGKPNYIPNMLTGRATKANPNPEPYQSPKKPFISNPDLMYVDHEIRSVEIVGKYIELTEEEHWAILMHNGMYGSFKYQIQGKETPLYLILHMADMWASRVTEKEDEGDAGEEA